MRDVRIAIPRYAKVVGRSLVIPVRVNWPELRLTEAQIVENAFALAEGMDPPHHDPSIFTITVEMEP